MPNKKYIDADGLKKLFTYGNADTSSEKAWVTLIRSSIENMPAADVAEVKRGEWIDKQSYTYSFDDITFSGTGECCSLCGWINKGGIDKHTNYCPNCGAKMSQGNPD